MTKEIQSEGGPFIVLSGNQKKLWGGIFRKTFVGNSQYENDYEAVSFDNEVVKQGPWLVASVNGCATKALLIALPYPVAMISCNDRNIVLAQIDVATDEFDLSMITPAVIDGVLFKFSVEQKLDGGQYYVFDSSYSGIDLEIDSIDFSIGGGEYVFEAGRFEPNTETSVIIYRLRLA